MEAKAVVTVEDEVVLTTNGTPILTEGDEEEVPELTWLTTAVSLFEMPRVSA